MRLETLDRVPQGWTNDIEEVWRARQIPARLPPRRGVHECAHQRLRPAEFAPEQVVREPFERTHNPLAPVPYVAALQDDDRRLKDPESGIEMAFAVSDHRGCGWAARGAETVGRAKQPVEDRTTVEHVSGSVGEIDEFLRVVSGRRQPKDRLQRERRTPEVWIAPLVSAVRKHPSVETALVVYRLVSLLHVRPRTTACAGLSPDDHEAPRPLRCVDHVEMSADVREMPFGERAQARRRRFALNSTRADEVTPVEYVPRHVILQGIEPRMGGVCVRGEPFRMLCRREWSVARQSSHLRTFAVKVPTELGEVNGEQDH